MKWVLLIVFTAHNVGDDGLQSGHVVLNYETEVQCLRAQVGVTQFSDRNYTRKTRCKAVSE